MPVKTTEARDNGALKDVLNVRETAAFLGCSESLVWKAIRQKQLAPFRLGDRVLFSRSYLLRLAAGE